MVRKFYEQTEGKHNIVNEIYRNLKRAGYDVFYFGNYTEEIGINIDNDIEEAKQVMREVKGLLLNMGAKLVSTRPQGTVMIFSLWGHKIDVSAYSTDIAITVYDD